MLIAILTLVAMEQRQHPKIKFSTRVLMGIALVAFVHHFACTLIYNAPYKPWSAQVDNYAKAYMYPYFYQGWKLFAPDVNEYYYTLDYRYFTGEGWTDYQSVNTLEGVAMKRRVQKIEHKLLVYLMRDVAKRIDFDDEEPDFEPVLSSQTYGRVLYYTYGRHLRAYGESPDSLQVRLRTKYTPEFRTGLEVDDRHYVFPAFKVADE